MSGEAYGAIKRIVEEVKEKRKASCLMKGCIVNQLIGGNDIELAEAWLDKTAKEHGDCVRYSDEWVENNIPF